MISSKENPTYRIEETSLDKDLVDVYFYLMVHLVYINVKVSVINGDILFTQTFLYNGTEGTKIDTKRTQLTTKKCR